MKDKGFSLVELAVVIAIIGLMLGTVLKGATLYFRNTVLRHASEDLKLIEQALIGYTLTHGRLPCPDVDDYPPTHPSFGSGADGAGNPSGVDCENHFGYLPWSDLGLEPYDPWKNRYFYGIDLNFADDPPQITDPNTGLPVDCKLTFTADNAFGNTTEGNGILRVMDGEGGETASIVAVFFSAGPNGNILLNPSADLSHLSTSADESENFDEDNFFLRKQHVPENAAQPEFDDMVKWISSFSLRAQAVNAGVLSEDPPCEP